MPPRTIPNVASRNREPNPTGPASSTSSQVASASTSPRPLGWILAAFVALAFAAGGLSGYFLRAPSPAPQSSGPLTPAEAVSVPDTAQPLRPGPWGNMEYQPLSIQPPDEYLPVTAIEQADLKWHFEGISADVLRQVITTADLSPQQREQLLDATKWEVSPSEININVPDALTESLSPQARRHIYPYFTFDNRTVAGRLIYAFPADRFDEFFGKSGLPQETVSLVRKLSYQSGNYLFFADMPLALKTLKTPEQKLKLLKAALTKPTYILRLHFTPDTDVSALERYWIRAGWGVDLHSLIESLAQIPGGARIDVVELLPPIPSANLYTFAFPAVLPPDEVQDCHWSSLNFFRDTPDPLSLTAAYKQKVFTTDYFPVMDDPRYGDIVALTRPNGDIIHTAVYIADDFAYTKNSGNYRDPFILMRIPEMLDLFSGTVPEDQKLTVHYLRNKYY